MGNELGIGFDYGSYTIAIKHNFNKAGTYEISNSYAAYIAEDRNPIISNSTMTYGTGSDGDYSYRKFGLAEDIHYTSDDESSVFFDLHAGVDASVNRTYIADYSYEINYGTNLVYVKDNNGNLSSQFQYGPQYTNSTTTTDSNVSFDLSAGAGAKVGTQSVEGNNLHAFANINQEVTNKHNTVARIGLGGKINAEVLGSEVAFFANGGYQHNFNNDSTHNWTNHSGAFFRAGAIINF